ncbi:HAD family hydrolase [Aestuariivirga litoralis]|uniref:HAD family hydrolase n=1 Tax=Aestuariivirga litoralis TaxID=2650924 RepID=UPI0018C4DF85|nr:HAD family hydrolase [Aestuariivirga litoralis]MBG1232546.1 HAD family hydrolase [Aestuariivirga litoralis]
MAHSKIELVIFDCDGVLIDSELLSAAVLMGMMAEVGLPITTEIFRSDFLGRSFASATLQVEKRFGRPFPPEFQMEYRERLLKRMRGTLKAMPGVQDVLKAMTIPFCLATSSSPPRLKVSMEESGLEPFFFGKSYTASLVTNGKPAPDLPLYAAAQMGAKPEHALVIEDSEMGLRSGLAAQMQTWHFTGGGHCKDAAPLPDDVRPHRVLDSMPALHNAFRELGIAK